jgi:hypothetical protein
MGTEKRRREKAGNGETERGRNGDKALILQAKRSQRKFGVEGSE